MKELSIEEKAKRYDEAIEKLRSLHDDYDTISTLIDIKEELEEMFPELKESEDERIIERIKKAVESYWSDEPLDEILAWLEKQGDLKREVNYPKFDFNDILALQCCMETVKKVQEDKELYEKLNDLHSRVYDAYQLEKQGEQKDVNEDAEKEKYDYVSGQFLYCKGSFNEFKEGESYWLEYIGNDTYVGRSDNILNQKFHITPRQLYTWLDPRHPEKQDEQKPNPCENCSIATNNCQKFPCAIRDGKQKPVEDIERKYNPCYNMSFEEAQEYISNRCFDIPWTDCDVFVDFRYVTQTVANILRWADDNPRQKPAWSEEDEDILNTIINHFKVDIECTDEDDIVRWLKSLKDRVQPQPKQEWSEEDESILQGIWDEILANKHDAKECEWKTYDKFLNWLKSLRPQNWTKEDKERYISCLQRLSTGDPKQPETINSKWFKEHVCPQPIWKPSEEQMKCLDNVKGSDDHNGYVLNTLYNDLKKLSEG